MTLTAPPLVRLPRAQAATLRWRDLAVPYAIAFVLLPVVSAVYFVACLDAADPYTPASDLPWWVNRKLEQLAMMYAALAFWAWPAAALSLVPLGMTARRGWAGLLPFVLFGAGFGAVSGVAFAGVTYLDLWVVAMISAAFGVFFSVQIWLYLLLRRPDLFLRRA